MYLVLGHTFLNRVLTHIAGLPKKMTAHLCSGVSPFCTEGRTNLVISLAITNHRYGTGWFHKLLTLNYKVQKKNKWSITVPLGRPYRRSPSLDKSVSYSRIPIPYLSYVLAVYLRCTHGQNLLVDSTVLPKHGNSWHWKIVCTE